MLRRFALLSLGLVVAATGCSDPYAGRKAVSGKVTLAGQPMKDGNVTFSPAGGQGSQGSYAVKDGAFKSERQDGLLPGKYVVRLSSADQKTTVNEAEAGGPGGSANVTFFDLVPAEWNSASKHEVEVKSDGPNEFTFDVPNVAKRGTRR